MIDKTFKELTTKEKFRLQGTVKKKRKGEKLNEEDQHLYDKFIGDYEAVEKSTKAKWPIIIGLIIISLFAVMRQCS